MYWVGVDYKQKYRNDAASCVCVLTAYYYTALDMRPDDLLYASHPQLFQRIWSQRLHFPRERPVEGGGVARERQSSQFGQLTQLRGYGSNKFISIKFELIQFGQFAQLRGYGSGKFVIHEPQVTYLCQLTQLRGYGSGNLVIRESQSSQFGQLAQLRG